MTEQSFSEWMEDLSKEDDALDMDGDCPACFLGNLDEVENVDKEGNSYLFLRCPNCGWEEG